jgi:hypothetical protein
MAEMQVMIGPHGGGLQNMVFMRQPGQFGVANWTDRASFGGWLSSLRVADLSACGAHF